MDMTKVQDVVDNVFTTVQDFTYTSPSSDIAAVTFQNLTGTQSLTVTQAGSYDFRNLTSANNITLGTSFKSSIGVVHFGALTQVEYFKTGTATHSLVFNKATELHLTSLKRYDTTSTASLTLEVDEGGVIDISALDDIDADGDQKDIFLEITGPSSVTISNFEDGALGFTDVAAVTVNDFNGSISTGSGVEAFTANKLVDAYTIGADIEDLDVTGALDPDVSTDQSGPAITSASDNLVNATIGGNVESVTLSGNNLESVTISADVAGAISISDSDDLTSITLTGSKASGVTIDDNDEITSLTIDTTIQKGRSTTAALTAALKLNGSVVVTDNTDLTELTISSSDLAVLTITGNSELANITASGIAAIGATAASNVVTIHSNNFTASKSTDNENTASTKTGTGEANDVGKFTTTSGFETLKTYLGLVAANTASTAEVYFDTVESVVGEDGDEDATDQTYAANPANTKVLQLTPKDVTVPALAASKHRVAFGIDLYALDGTANNKTWGLATSDGDDILSDGTDAGTGVESITLSTNVTLAIAKLKSAANLARAAAYDLVIDAHEGYSNTGLITFENADNDSEFSTTATGALNITANSDVLTLTIDGLSVTTTAATATLDGIAAALGARWNAVYGEYAAGNSYSASLFKVVSDWNNVGFAESAINIVAKTGSGRRGFDKSYSVALTPYTTTAGANYTPVLGAKYGATDSSADNKTIADGIIITIESVDAGTLLDKVGSLVYTFTAASPIIYKHTSTLLVNDSTDTTTASTSSNAYPHEARGDAINVENAQNEVATAAVSFSRVHWL
jgi:hypothetical protein